MHDRTEETSHGGPFFVDIDVIGLYEPDRAAVTARFTSTVMPSGPPESDD